MFCPLCRAEYREGFYTCADCSVSLVYELPRSEGSTNTAQHAEFLEILSTRNPAEVAITKSILDAEDIPYYFVGEQMMASPLLSGGGAARLFIAAQDIARAKELLKDLEFENPDLLLGILQKF